MIRFSRKTEYVVISRAGACEISDKISDMINRGWKPQGGVCYNTKDCRYIQAMTRKYFRY